MKIRTIDRGYDEYRETIDPHTCMSRHSWRQIVISRKLKSSRKSGIRWLYDLEEMISYLKNPPDETSNNEQVINYGQLRKIQG